MKPHPVLSNKVNLAFYSLAWILIISIQTFALVQLFNFNWVYAIVDGMVYGALFYLFGIGLWFFIRFNEFQKQSTFSILIEHTSSLIIIVSIWVISGIYLLSAIFSDKPEIQDFLWEAISWRYLNGFLMYIVLILFYYLNSYYTHMQQRQKKENDLLRTLKDTEINLLRSKLNPHFLFNSLNSLHALIQIQPEKATDMLLELSDYLRFSLNQDYKKLISLDDEMLNLERYLAIETMRFGAKIDFIRTGEADCKEMKIPALILQPLLENAIKYGLQGDVDKVKITFNCHKEQGNLYLELINNFDDKTAHRKGSGTGLYTVRKRLEILFKQYHLFKVEKKSNTFSVRLIVPQNIKTDD